MSPEVLDSGTGDNAFAQMAAEMPSYDRHMADLPEQNLEAPPSGEPSPIGESAPTDTRPASDQGLTAEQPPAGAQGEQNQAVTSAVETTAPATTSTPDAPRITGTTRDTSTSVESSASANPSEAIKPTAENISKPSAETAAETADFSEEELKGIQDYADKLESDAKSDQKMADLLHQFVSIASRQSSNAPHESVQNTSPIPDVAAAITEALAETSSSDIPGQVPIVTPREPVAGEASLAV